MISYYISEKSFTLGTEKNAGSKARTDVEKMLDKKSVKMVEINLGFSNSNSFFAKAKRYFIKKENFKKIKKRIQKKGITNSDILFFQFPLSGLSLDDNLAFLKLCNKKRIRTCAIIHDLPHFRIGLSIDKDIAILNNATILISHNANMTQLLKSYGLKKDVLVFELGLFDYLLDGFVKTTSAAKTDPIVVAGNLSKSKSSYIYLLNKNTCCFNLYGVGYEDNKKNNIFYKGSFLPEELPNNIYGSFGLVWDGTSVFSCDGPTGNYLRYNNPHKASLYLASGLPLIVWKQSALNNFVVNNKCGICVDSLSELQSRIKNLSEAEYDLLCQNAKTIGSLCADGHFFNNVYDKILEAIK